MKCIKHHPLRFCDNEKSVSEDGVSVSAVRLLQDATVLLLPVRIDLS
jgi:hypothetical protein